MIYLAYIVALVLVLICIFAVLVILMQRPSANAGMGAALGRGAAESVFGGDSANVLNKVTYGLVSIFFVLCFGLYLGFIAIGNSDKSGSSTLDEIKATSSTAPAETAPVAEETPSISAPESQNPATPEIPAPAPAQ